MRSPCRPGPAPGERPAGHQPAGEEEGLTRCGPLRRAEVVQKQVQDVENQVGTQRGGGAGARGVCC